MNRPEISVVIPTYNREEVLINTINDVFGQSFKNFELLVIDQSLDHNAKTKESLTAFTDKRFRYVQADPPSLPGARNLAFELARAPIVLFLDDDVKLHKDLLKHHLEAYKLTPKPSAVGGRVLQEGFPIKKDVLKFDEFAISHGVFTATEAAYTNAFPGGNCSFFVKDALAAGGFDTRYRGNAFREESDMSLKMTRKGYKIYYEPRAELLHLAAPYGGLRVQGHIYDSATFYRNEMLFTIRGVAFSNLPKALRLKYKEYTHVTSRRIKLRRALLFSQGFIHAVFVNIFGRQLITRVRQ